MAADIQRYLDDQPISARPPSTAYQLGKFARRNRALVAGVASVFLVLIAGVAASTWEAIRAKRASATAFVERDRAAAATRLATNERDRALRAQRTAAAAEANAVAERNRAVAQTKRADEEAEKAKAVNDFLRNDLVARASARSQARPDTKPDPDLKVRTVLDRAAGVIGTKFSGRPVVEASIRQTIGETYLDLGIYPEAQKQMERAMDIRRRALGEDHPDTLTTASDLADLYSAQGKYAQSEILYSK
jgi:hypothetical protein